MNLKCTILARATRLRMPYNERLVWFALGHTRVCPRADLSARVGYAGAAENGTGQSIWAA